MKLIPTNDRWKEMDVIKDLKKGDITSAIRFNNYVDLTEMELKLWMFVPCDGEGNVLQYPTDQYNSPQYYEAQRGEYLEAKQRVIFEGFEVYDSTGLFTSIRGAVLLLYDNKMGEFLHYSKIKDLTHLGLTLTQGAKENYDL